VCSSAENFNKQYILQKQRTAYQGGPLFCFDEKPAAKDASSMGRDNIQEPDMAYLYDGHSRASDAYVQN